jgi:hypothetical protein
MQQFVAAPGQSFENVELKLRGTAAGLQGLVVDIRGQPVPWATVLVGPPGGGVTNSGNMNFIQPNPERRLTGAMADLWPRGCLLVMCRSMCGLWGLVRCDKQIVTTAGRTESITVTLVDGAMVAGVVRDSAGKPVVKATVRFGDEFFSFPSCSTTTDEAGRFRLENLPAAPESASLVATDGKASARASLLLTAGATTEWNPVLGTGKTIRGIVLGPGEVPLPGTKVGVVHPNFQRVQRWFDAGADGTFLLQQVGDEPCSVQVAVGESVLREVRRVAPETADLRILLGARDLPTARLRGRIVDMDGKPLEGSVSLLRDRVLTSDSVQLDPRTGAFAFGPISAGRYRVLAYTKATGQLPLGAVELQPDEERVLADVVVQPGGEVDYTVTDVEGEPVDSRLVRLYTASGESISGGVLERGKGRLAGLQPGRYLVEVHPERKRGSNKVAQVLRANIESAEWKIQPSGDPGPCVHRGADHVPRPRADPTPNVVCRCSVAMSRGNCTPYCRRSPKDARHWWCRRLSLLVATNSSARSMTAASSPPNSWFRRLRRRCSSRSIFRRVEARRPWWCEDANANLQVAARLATVLECQQRVAGAEDVETFVPAVVAPEEDAQSAQSAGGGLSVAHPRAHNW